MDETKQSNTDDSGGEEVIFQRTADTTAATPPRPPHTTAAIDTATPDHLSVMSELTGNSNADRRRSAPASIATSRRSQRDLALSVSDSQREVAQLRLQLQERDEMVTKRDCLITELTDWKDDWKEMYQRLSEELKEAETALAALREDQDTRAITHNQLQQELDALTEQWDDRGRIIERQRLEIQELRNITEGPSGLVATDNLLAELDSRDAYILNLQRHLTEAQANLARQDTDTNAIALANLDTEAKSTASMSQASTSPQRTDRDEHRIRGLRRRIDILNGTIKNQSKEIDLAQAERNLLIQDKEALEASLQVLRVEIAAQELRTPLRSLTVQPQEQTAAGQATDDPHENPSANPHAHAADDLIAENQTLKAALRQADSLEDQFYTAEFQRLELQTELNRLQRLYGIPVSTQTTPPVGEAAHINTEDTLRKELEECRHQLRASQHQLALRVENTPLQKDLDEYKHQLRESQLKVESSFNTNSRLGRVLNSTQASLQFQKEETMRFQQHRDLLQAGYNQLEQLNNQLTEQLQAPTKNPTTRTAPDCSQCEDELSRQRLSNIQLQQQIKRLEQAQATQLAALLATEKELQTATEAIATKDAAIKILQQHVAKPIADGDTKHSTALSSELTAAVAAAADMSHRLHVAEDHLEHVRKEAGFYQQQYQVQGSRIEGLDLTVNKLTTVADGLREDLHNSHQQLDITKEQLEASILSEKQLNTKVLLFRDECTKLLRKVGRYESTFQMMISKRKPSRKHDFGIEPFVKHGRAVTRSFANTDDFSSDSEVEFEQEYLDLLITHARRRGIPHYPGPSTATISPVRTTTRPLAGSSENPTAQPSTEDPLNDIGQHFQQRYVITDEKKASTAMSPHHDHYPALVGDERRDGISIKSFLKQYNKWADAAGIEADRLRIYCLKPFLAPRSAIAETYSSLFTGKLTWEHFQTALCDEHPANLTDTQRREKLNGLRVHHLQIRPWQYQ